VTPVFIDELFKYAIIKEKVFSFALNDGFMRVTIGGINETYVPQGTEITWNPLSSNIFWSLKLVGV